MEVTGKQIKEFVDKFEPEELMTMCAAISHSIAEAKDIKGEDIVWEE